MATEQKSGGVFTRNGMTSGPSAGLKRTSMPGGGSDLAAYPQDNVHGMDLPNCRGGSFGGSDSNLSHSLQGASAVQRSKGKPESSGI